MLLVTGITGHTGRYFLQELIHNNYKERIRCVVRRSSNTEALRNSGLNIEIVIGDLDDKSFIKKIVKDVKTVFHIYNIHHSLNIIEAAIENNVQRAILVHTTGIYSKYKSASKEYMSIESEVIRKAKDKINLTILRPTMIYGNICDHNMSKFIKMIDKIPIFPLIDGGKGLIQPVNARDLGKAYYDVLIRPEATANKQYDLSGDTPITIKDALSIVSHKLGKNTIFIPVPMSVSVLAVYLLKILTLGKFDVVEKVLRMGEDRAYSHKLAEKDFNYSPMPFDEGIEIEIDEYKIIKKAN